MNKSIMTARCADVWGAFFARGAAFVLLTFVAATDLAAAQTNPGEARMTIIAGAGGPKCASASGFPASDPLWK